MLTWTLFEGLECCNDDLRQISFEWDEENGNGSSGNDGWQQMEIESSVFIGRAHQHRQWHTLAIEFASVGIFKQWWAPVKKKISKKDGTGDERKIEQSTHNLCQPLITIRKQVSTGNNGNSREKVSE